MDVAPLHWPNVPFVSGVGDGVHCLRQMHMHVKLLEAVFAVVEDYLINLATTRP